MANFYFESQGGSLQPDVFRAPRPSEIHYHTSLDSCLSNRKDKQLLNTNRLQIITNQHFALTKLPTNPFITITPVYLNQPETCFSSSRTTQDIHTHTHPGLHTRTTWRPPSLTARQQVCCWWGGGSRVVPAPDVKNMARFMPGGRPAPTLSASNDDMNN